MDGWTSVVGHEDEDGGGGDGGALPLAGFPEAINCEASLGAPSTSRLFDNANLVIIELAVPLARVNVLPHAASQILNAYSFVALARSRKSGPRSRNL